MASLASFSQGLDSTDPWSKLPIWLHCWVSTAPLGSSDPVSEVLINPVFCTVTTSFSELSIYTPLLPPHSLLTNHGTNPHLSIHSTSPLPPSAKIWFLWSRTWVEKWFLVRFREALRAPSNFPISRALEASPGNWLLKFASRRLGVSRWVPS
jgi:hypothetical protein